jgi:hypothetical protein
MKPKRGERGDLRKKYLAELMFVKSCLQMDKWKYFITGNI